jgi:threonine aldolase
MTAGRAAVARGFASDNYAGAHPEVLDALAAVNDGHVPGYGDDPVTARLNALVRERFGPDTRAFCVFNGTGANVLALQALLRPWQAVICADTAHLAVDEAGAPERIAGTKLLTVPTPHGKLTPELAATRYERVDDVHAVEPRVLSLTQSTELGTVYTPDELRNLTTWAHDRGLVVHVDGARLANAAAALDCDLRAITTDAGVDVVTLGGTKGGLLGAEAVLVLRPGLGEGIERLRKQSMQLASKMRFLSAQLDVYLREGLWRRTAAHANAMARGLHRAVHDIEGVHVVHPVEANAVFAALPSLEVTRQLQERWPFYVWDDATGVVRWMCSWDTTPQDVEAFAADVRAACATSERPTEVHITSGA